MVAIPAPTHAREEWPEADFDLPDGDVIRPPSDPDFDKDEEEDWDVEMDLGKTGGAKVTSVMQGLAIRRSPPRGTMVTIRPTLATLSEPLSPLEADEDEGISTIKISALPTTTQQPSETSPVIEDDMEADFALPANLTQLSLRPLSLHHRGSKASLEWGDRDHTSSSASSSDAYSTLGFHASKGSTSASLNGTDDDCDDEEDNDLDGLVIPTGLFESDQGRKHLTKILDLKKKIPKIEERVKVASPDPEDDFEIGLVINGDDDLSPSKFAQTQQTKRTGTMTARSNSMPARPSTSIALRPPSRLKADRPKTPVCASSGSTRGSSRISTSPPLRPSLSRRTFQPLPLPQPGTVPPSVIAPKQGLIRSQKSHGVLKTPPANSRKLNRKASLSSLLETSSAQDSSAPESSTSQQPKGYSAATASSRARMHMNSTSRMHSVEQIPPARPSTPSSNPAALRLTMPTNLSRVKSRPSITNIFPPPTPPLPLPPTPKDAITQYRPPSRASTSSTSAPVKSIRRTKRRVFGDGTELDAFEDLPTDRDREAQFRKPPKGIQSRIPAGSSNQLRNDNESGKNTIRRKRELSEHSVQPSVSSLSLRNKQSRLEGLSHLSKNENPQKRKPSTSSTTGTRRKPTLIRHLGGVGAPKTVGEMRWNPQTLRWEGNDQALREFDSASSRPALITHLTGTSMGSPHGSFGSSARVVGNMVFDPVRMCWMSTLAPEEEEPDVFADLADDEEDGDWEAKGGTIRASQQQAVREASTNNGKSEGSRKTPSPVPSTRSRSHSQSDSDHASRASLVFDVEDNFIELCRQAETRHRTEIRGWTLGRSDSHSSSYNEPNRSYLYEIRTLATRQY